MKSIDELGISPWPWKADLTVDDDSWVEDAKSNDILRLGKYGRRNTNLIAAAPEMYDALQRIIQASEDSVNDFPSWRENLCKALDDARAALAKAAGEEVSNG